MENSDFSMDADASLRIEQQFGQMDMGEPPTIDKDDLFPDLGLESSLLSEPFQDGRSLTFSGETPLYDLDQFNSPTQLQVHPQIAIQEMSTLKRAVDSIYDACTISPIQFNSSDQLIEEPPLKIQRQLSSNFFKTSPVPPPLSQPISQQQVFDPNIADAGSESEHSSSSSMSTPVTPAITPTKLPNAPNAGKMTLTINIYSVDDTLTCSADGCSKVFSDRSNLIQHIRTHTEEKPYECPNCPKAFSHTASLKEHMRLHSGQRPFKCEYCSKSFTQNSNFKRHLRIHSGEKPYGCDICGKFFNQASNLKTHKKKVHHIV